VSRTNSSTPKRTNSRSSQPRNGRSPQGSAAVWLSDGIEDGNGAALADYLAGHGTVRYVAAAEADTPLRTDHWFWHPDDEKSLKPLAELVETYHKTVGRGAQLMLGLAPDKRGLLPDSDVARLHEFGAAIRRIYGDEGGGARDAP